MSESKKYDAARPELTDRAIEMLKRDREYVKLNEKLAKQKAGRQYIQAMQTQQRIDAMVRQAIHKVVRQDIEDNLGTEEVVAQMEPVDGLKYRDCLTALAICFDVMDSVFVDINALLRKGKIGVSEQFPEIEACKRKVAAMIGMGMKSMDEDSREEYYDETDSIYRHILARSGDLRQRCEEIRKKKEKPSEATDGAETDK